MSKREPYAFEEPSVDGPQLWRSLEERAKRGDPELRKEFAAEFPRNHFTTPPSEEASTLGRRGFMTIMGASLALAGAEGCRRPIEKIVPYQRLPEQVIPGVSTHYATVYNRRGEALGLLVESHEGRPTKIEGNPDHPASFGGADLIAQASILDLYDVDRSTNPHTGGKDTTWDAFEKMATSALKAHEADQGARLRVLMQPTNSPTVRTARQELIKRFTKARVYTYASVNDSNSREGTRIAFGQPVQALYSYERANVVLALDSDFLQTEPGNVAATRRFAGRRSLPRARQGEGMSRLYVVEPMLTTTGTNADHRLRLPATDVERYLMALTAQLAQGGLDLGPLADAVKASAKFDAIPQKWITAVAKELLDTANHGKSIIIAGSRQPPAVHAVVHALNLALGNVATAGPINYLPTSDPEEKDSATEIRDLGAEMASGAVDTLLILGGNPVYDAPADSKFAEGLTKVKLSIHLASTNDETGSRCTWHLPRAHELESWGDQASFDGTISIQQPLIAPLWGGRSDAELLALFADLPNHDGHSLVRATQVDTMLAARELTQISDIRPDHTFDCKDRQGNLSTHGVGELEKSWKLALRDGFLPPSKAPRFPTVDTTRAAANAAAVVATRKLAASPTKDNLEVVFAACPKMLDGRHANNAWLQELPDPITKIVWDNVAVLSPTTAGDLGIKNGDMLTLNLGGRQVSIAAWVLPGQTNNTIAVTMGWGRTKAGRLGNGKGFNVNPLRGLDSMYFATGVKVTKNGESYSIGQTQDHNSMEGRAVARDATYEDYVKWPNFADMQTPPPRALPLWSDQDYSEGYQWGMTIDLNACTGCNACVIACQAENNIPVVGKIEVARGREMQWLRIDRYFVTGADPAGGQKANAHASATDEDPLVAHQPLACVQCEEAPCENVCPVNATTHSPEGLNDMAYNRCIGTRYCANNCPYKVRRFNYLNWHNDSVWKKEGGLPDSYQMQQNPNVTVRFRGVMEKCTYCVQRIQTVKIRAKRENRAIKDGEIATACSATCPASAIVFGNLNDPKSAVTYYTRLDRQYKLLGELGTKPRTTYLGKVRNPNPEMA